MEKIILWERTGGKTHRVTMTVPPSPGYLEMLDSYNAGIAAMQRALAQQYVAATTGCLGNFL